MGLLPPFPGFASVHDLQLGDHVCLPVDSGVERLAGTVWLAEVGLRSGGKVLVFAETETPDEMSALLDARLPGGGAALASGQLQVLTCREVYLPGGVFDQDRMMAAYFDQIDVAHRQGYAGLWAAVDMAWGLSGLLGTEQLLGYEAAVNPSFASGRLAAGCLYDRSRFTPELIEGACSAHPLTPGQAPLRFTGTIDPPGLALTGELDLTNREALTALLTSLHSAPGHITIDANGLQFVDLRAADLLYEVCMVRGRDATTIVGSPVLDRLLELVAHSRSVISGWPEN